MDPFVVLDCAKVLPNRFALTLAAAARSRALCRGGEPKLARPSTNVIDLALHEIAESAFTSRELESLLLGSGDAQSLAPSTSDHSSQQLSRSDRSGPASSAEDAARSSATTNVRRRMNDAEVTFA